MSATRDKSQKFTFVYKNLYRIYQTEKKSAAEEAGGQPQGSRLVEPETRPFVVLDADRAAAREAVMRPESGRVLKAGVVPRGALGNASPADESSRPRVTEYRPAELLGKRIVVKNGIGSRPEAVAQQPVVSQAEAIRGLKANLANLSELQSRIRFMLKELEDLVKED